MIVLVALGLVLFISLAYGIIVAYPAMLLFGAVHSFLPVVPAFGFWQTLAVVLLARLLFGSSGSSVKS
jgi:hypothetical protein